MFRNGGSVLALTAVVTGGRGRSARTLEARVGAFPGTLPASLELGTLNLVLDRPILLRPQMGLWRENETNFRAFPAKLNGLAVFILRWKRCRGHVFEVISDSLLREALSLQDGDRVTITIEEKYLDNSRARWWRELWFSLLWRGREHRYYDSNLYPKLVGPIELIARVLQK